MTEISNYRVNTHYTALKQLPRIYGTSFNIGGTYGYGLGQLLGSATIDVPPGVYVETPLIRCGLDGRVNHLSSEIAFVVNNYGTVYISLTHISDSQYELKAILNNTGDATVAVPSSVVETLLALSTAPF